MPKLLLHIGLPKTATTTIQYELFESAPVNRVNYLGVLQPREQRQQKPLYRALYSAICQGEAMEDVRQKLAAVWASDSRDILFSDEMVLVSQPDRTWRWKLRNLARLTQGLHYSILITVREPASALFSYYTELYPGLCREGISYEQFALSDERGEIFHFKTLLNELYHNFAVENISFFKFEDIVGNNVGGISSLLGMSAHEAEKPHLGVHNSRLRTSGHVIRTHPRTLMSWLREMCRHLGIKPAAVKGVIPAAASVAGILNHIALPAKHFAVRQPEPATLASIRKQLRDQTLALRKVCSIDYLEPEQ